MVPNARKAPTQPGLITRSAYSAEPSRRAAPERRTARQGRPSGRAPAPRSAHIAHAPPSAEPPGRGKTPSSDRPAGQCPKTRRGPQGTTPLRCPLAPRCRAGAVCAATPIGPPATPLPPHNAERPARGDPPAGLSGACRARARRDAAALRAHRKAPSASATPCPPAALRCSTLGEGGLNCRVRDGTG